MDVPLGAVTMVPFTRPTGNTTWGTQWDELQPITIHTPLLTPPEPALETITITAKPWTWQAALLAALGLYLVAKLAGNSRG